MPEKSVSAVDKFTESKHASANFPKITDNKESTEHEEQFDTIDSSGSDSVCSSTSESSIQTQVCYSKDSTNFK